MGRRLLGLVLGLSAGNFALAQETPPALEPEPATSRELAAPHPVLAAPAPAPAPTAPPAADEDSPADRQASMLYEEAIRADALGKSYSAQQSALEALDASPNGRYAPAVRRLLDRLTSEALLEAPRPPDNTAIGSRVGYVISGGLIGAMSGALSGLGTGTVSGVAGISLLGSAIGVGATLASAGAVDDGSMPTHLWAGATLGGWFAAGVLLAAANNPSPELVGGVLGAGVAAGALAGALLGAETRLTAADGLAGLVIGNELLGDVLLLETSGQPTQQSVAITVVALATLGYVGGELLNRGIHWSGGRWALVFLSAGLGLGLGGLIAGIASSSGGAIQGLLATGSIVGFGVGCAATIGMAPDEPRAFASAAAPQAIQNLAAIPAIPRTSFSWTF